MLSLNAEIHEVTLIYNAALPYYGHTICTCAITN
jgi:hypothetical protein